MTSGGAEIYVYKNGITSQVTTNNYGDFNPDIHNGQIVWAGKEGGADLEIFLAIPNVTGFGLEMLDGSDFSSGTEVSNNPQTLAVGGSNVEGVVTDGVTRLLLRVNVPNPGGVTFTLNGTGNPDEDGVFRSIDGLQTGSTITVNSVTTSQGEQAFVIYQAPGNFVRAGFESTDGVISERTLPIKVELTSGAEPPIDNQLRLMRPPLILVHGLWSNSDTWDSFSWALQNTLTGYMIIQADYRNTNDEEFIVNRDVVGYHIRVAKGILKNTFRIAMTQADVMGHSMGGILSRIHYGGAYWPGGFPYLKDINFRQGNINKLITIDSVHYGSFLADFAINLKNTLPPVQKLIYLSLANSLNKAVDQGAVQDLTTGSSEINFLNTILNTVNPTSTALAGDYQIPTDLSLIPGPIGDFYNLLNFYGGAQYYDLIPGQSDLVVSTTSQIGGISTDPIEDIFNHSHNGFASIEVFLRTLTILNANLSDIIFDDGFPTNTYP